jgi:hypothetical protein
VNGHVPSRMTPIVSTMDVMGWCGSASRITAATLSLVLVGACSAGNSEGTGQSQGPSPTVTSGGPAPSPTPSPVSISVKEYSTRLAKAIDPLESALTRLAAAKTYKGLERRVSDVEIAAAKAGTALGQLNPPAELAKPNAQLVAALRAFEGEAGSLSSKVDERSLCTGSVVRAGLGNADATAALRTSLASVYAKLPGDQPALKLPSAGQKAGSHPSNGTYIRDRNRGGRAELAIDNGGSADAVVTLSKGGKPAIAVYVRKGKTYTVRNVSDGSYAVFFSGGAGWDDAAHAFGRNCTFSRFEDPLRFRTTRDARGIYWQNFRITLQPVIGGTARTDDVDPDDFPDS